MICCAKCGKQVMRHRSTAGYATFLHVSIPGDGHEVLLPGNCPATTEVISTDQDSGGQKGTKLARFSLLPWDVLYELAEHFGRGAKKYADRNWEKGYSWGLSIDALGRHLALWVSGEDTDEETGSSHLIAVAWHALALRAMQKWGRGHDFRTEKNL